jgi:hypothetical protein
MFQLMFAFHFLGRHPLRENHLPGHQYLLQPPYDIIFKGQKSEFRDSLVVRYMQVPDAHLSILPDGISRIGHTVSGLTKATRVDQELITKLTEGRNVSIAHQYNVRLGRLAVANYLT